MKRKVWGIGLVIVLIGAMAGGLPAPVKEAQANPGNITWVPDNYSTIQAAVNASSPGDTITVRDGTYNENVDVNVANLTIQSQNGSASCVVSASNSSDPVFNVTANWTNITGFTVQNAIDAYGIYLYYADHCNISDNKATNNYYGIYLDSSSNSTLTNNTASNNTQAGIYLSSSSNDTITGNNVTLNGDGIYMYDTTNMLLEGNTVMSNTAEFGGEYGDGIRAAGTCNDTVIRGNNISYNNYGIDLYGGDFVNFTIVNNSVSYHFIGLWIGSMSDSTVEGNEISSATGNPGMGILGLGIFLGSSDSNNITGNTAFNNTDCGIHLESSSNNTIYNNYCNNTNNAYDDGTNAWNTTKTAGTNIIGGPYLGGNYWSDYPGPDIDGDGLGNIPYNITGDSNRDYLPLMLPGSPNLTVDVTGNGSVTANGMLLTGYPNTTTWDDGAVVNITATPDANYSFINWTGDVSTIGDVNASSTTIDMTDNYSIVANFIQVNYTLTTNSTGGGNVTVPCDNCTTGPYGNGTVVELRALPDIGYMFVNWTGNTSNISNVNCSVTTITMLANYTVTANFAASPAPTSACGFIGANDTAGTNWGYKGNNLTFGGSYTLTEIQQELSLTVNKTIWFFVMYNATGGTTFTQIYCQPVDCTTGRSMRSSGNISVPVNSTGRWWIGAAWNGSAGNASVTYYYGAGTGGWNFGSGINGTLGGVYTRNGVAPCQATIIGPASDTVGYRQRLCLQTVVVDTYPPAAVVNLIATAMNSTTVNLTWTAPGDDGMNGTAASYDIRYSNATINESNWASATQCSGEPAPAAAGSSQSFIVGSLTPGTPYYFAMKTSDEVPNTACLSNVASATPSAGTSDITGVVYEANASVVPGANVTLSGPEAKNTTTNATGYYSFTVGATGNYTVNVTKGGFFSPVQKQINVTVPNPVSCNFTGMDAPYRTAPDGYYCTKCSNLWLMGGFYPVEFRLNATRVSDVLYAWTHPS